MAPGRRHRPPMAPPPEGSPKRQGQERTPASCAGPRLPPGVTACSRAFQAVALVSPVAIGARHGGHLLAIPRAPHPPPPPTAPGSLSTPQPDANGPAAGNPAYRLDPLAPDFGINDGAIIDLFTDRWDPLEFSRAVDAVVEAYRREVWTSFWPGGQGRWCGWKPPSQRTAGRGRWTWPQTSETKTGGELDSPGPRRSRRGSDKVATVFSRGYARDHLDLAGILASGEIAVTNSWRWQRLSTQVSRPGGSQRDCRTC